MVNTEYTPTGLTVDVSERKNLSVRLAAYIDRELAAGGCKLNLSQSELLGKIVQSITFNANKKP